MPGFTHLHTVSGFSMRYGGSHPERLAQRAAERGMDALALTDRDGLAGSVRFAKACAKAGIRPLFGVDLAVSPAGSPAAGPAGSGRSGAGSGTASGPGSPGAGSGGVGPGGAGRHGSGPGGASYRRRSPVKGGAFVDESAPRAVFLARDGATGWAELCRMVTAAHAGAAEAAGDLSGPTGPAAGGFAVPAPSGAGARQPVLPWSAHRGEGVFVLLGPGSEVGRALAAGRPDRAARLLAPWREVYGDHLRLEAVHHGRGGTGPGSLRLAARTVGFAAEQGVRAVLTNAVRYADPGQGPVADILDAARRLVPIDPRAPLDSGERWLKDPGAMAEAADRIARAAGLRPADARQLLAETRRTAEACAVDPEDDLGMGSVHFPEARLVGAAHRSAQRVLASRASAGMVLHGYADDRAYWERMHQELDIIAYHGYASYFLTVAQVVDDVKEMGIRVAARGSGAGSLVNHLLGIAHADPVANGLLMERFLSKRRRVLPDIDIDVESARRLEVYRRILDRFGAERVATVSMPETYRVRHAIRDVGAALSMDPAAIDRLAKSFPHIRARDARAALEELPELRGVRDEVRGESHGRLWELVESLDALPRGIAMHPCGMLLSDASLLARTPVVPTSGEGFPMSQFDKDDVEELGLLKLDVLGVRMQSAMAHAVAEIRRGTGREIDLDDPAHVPPGDPATYELIRSAQTLGCFQIESPGQRDLVGRLQPSTFDDLVVDISLFRPGPVAADMVRPFIEARHGRAPVRFPHPDLAGALRETYGVVVFHEQIIEIVHVMTGCGRDEADRVRRGLSDPQSQERIKAWFAAKAAERGYPVEVIGRTWEIVAAFGSYGFCKAHAVAFAVPTYQSAWLKTHHPAAFYAGLLTHDPGMYPKRLLLADARRRGVPVLPLDVNRSAVAHRIELVSDEGVWGLRLGLSDVHGINEAEAARIAAGRPYASLRDFWDRARPGRPVAERLAQVGALDAFGANRRDLLLHVSELHGAQRAAGVRGSQLPLEGGRSTASVGLPDLSDAERLSAELGVLGMDASRHLMADHHAFLEELGAIPARRLRDAEHGQTVLVAGAKAATQTPPIRSGRRVIFTTLDDGTGLVDLAFFDDSHERCAHTVFHSFLLLVRGVVQRRGPQSMSVVGAAAWNLAELVELRSAGGLDAVAARLAAGGGASADDASAGGTSGGGTSGGGASADGETKGEADGGADGGAGRGGGPVPTRRIRLSTGFEMNAWADLQPPGPSAATGRKLWHSSPGSAG
ncbi:DNA polymerase III subunit alpha [Streptomyces sp. CB00455]|uniref:DNA polymerase III subunit alpha n=1 Tax=Streptomyces sp. CB00455 TaxID=1703927 RepID=UPI000938A25B|nr:DNA polymerase III subunit alpha [Streptomyces sp. CB00455]OKK14611.1 DNA polymerase III subunit alpha [Streptomyces sp. CB00455]